MRKKKIVSVITAALVAVQLVSAVPVSAQATTNTGAVDTESFIRGVDVSTLDMIRKCV